MAVDEKHAALPPRLHQQGQVIGRRTTPLYIRFDHGSRLIFLDETAAIALFDARREWLG